MIESLGPTLLSSLALVAMLGFRHGFDADHIAVVDGMTRARQLHKSYWTSRLVGAQFAVESPLCPGPANSYSNWLARQEKRHVRD